MQGSVYSAIRSPSLDVLNESLSQGGKDRLPQRGDLDQEHSNVSSLTVISEAKAISAGNTAVSTSF